MTFQGTHTALVTPFRDGEFDQASFMAHIERQIAGGVDGIVPVGTTGESPTLTHPEHAGVIRTAIETAAGRVPVIAGTGSNSTAEAISLSERAEEMGADALLLVAPYYNKPSQEGLFRHFRAVAEKVTIPIILYSIPGRCGIEISVPTVVRLASECPNIRAIKEAGGSVERVSQLRSVLPDDFEILSGDDSLTLPFLSVGATGVISVASNLFPSEVADLVRSGLTGEIERAHSLHRILYPLFKDLFLEPNPVPAKYCLSLMGFLQPEVRLPLCEMSSTHADKVRQTLEQVQADLATAAGSD